MSEEVFEPTDEEIDVLFDDDELPLDEVLDVDDLVDDKLVLEDPSLLQARGESGLMPPAFT